MTGAISLAVVVILVPSQAAGCDSSVTILVKIFIRKRERQTFACFVRFYSRKAQDKLVFSFAKINWNFVATQKDKTQFKK